MTYFCASTEIYMCNSTLNYNTELLNVSFSTVFLRVVSSAWEKVGDQYMWLNDWQMNVQLVVTRCMVIYGPEPCLRVMVG